MLCVLSLSTVLTRSPGLCPRRHGCERSVLPQSASFWLDLRIRTTGSPHGTYLGSNGSTDLLQRLTTELHSLKSGDVLSFGKHVYGDDYQGQSGVYLAVSRA